MRVTDKEHLLEFTELLVANDVDTSRPRCRLHYEAELLVAFLCQSNHICGQWHGLHALDLPFVLLISILLFFIIVVFVLEILIFIDLIAKHASFLHLAVDEFGHGNIDAQFTVKVVGAVIER